MNTKNAPIKAPTGTQISCKGWHQEAAMRLLMNNLDPDVAEKPDDLVVYGGTGKAALYRDCLERIISTLHRLENDETLLIQSGKPDGVFRTHEEAPRVLIANSNLVARWSDWNHFRELEKKGLTMYGQMTAGSWIYIGAQPLACTMNDGNCLAVEVDPWRIERRVETHYYDRMAHSLDEALEMIEQSERPISVGLVGNIGEVLHHHRLTYP